MKGPFSFYNGFWLKMAIVAVPHEPAITVMVLAASADSGHVIPGKLCWPAADLSALELQTASVEWSMPGLRVVQGKAPMDIRSIQHRSSEGAVALLQLRHLAVGPDAVRNTPSLVAVLQMPWHQVLKVSQDDVDKAMWACTGRPPGPCRGGGSGALHCMWALASSTMRKGYVLSLS